MAYQSRDLSVLAYANGFTMWVYNPQSEPIEAIGAADYFNEARDLLRVGDLIVVSAVQDGQGKGDMLHVCGVNAEGDGRVDVESIAPGGLLAFANLRPLDNGGPKVAQ